MKLRRSPRGYEEAPERYGFDELRRDLPEEATAVRFQDGWRAEFGINPSNKRLIAWVSPGRSASYKWYEYVSGSWTEFTP